MSTHTTRLGFRMKLPLTEEQEDALARLRHEDAIRIGLLGAVDPSQVANMDGRRIAATREIAIDIAELRCAALRTILVQEEQRKS